MSRDFKSIALSLKSEKSTNNDRVVTFLTRSGSIIRAKCYGARKTVRGLKIPVYSEGVFNFYKQNERMITVKDVDLISTHDDIKSSYESEIVFSLFSELVIKTPGLDEKAYELFLSALDRVNEYSVYRIAVVFVARFLFLVGLSGDYQRCPKCLREYGDDETLGFSEGMAMPVCSSCDESGGTFILPPSARKYLKRVVEVECDHAYRLNISEMMENRLFHYIIRVLHFFPQKLMSLNILEKEL